MDAGGALIYDRLMLYLGNAPEGEGPCCSDCAVDDARRRRGARVAATLGRSAVTRTGLHGLEGDPLIWTPGAISDLVSEIDAQIKTLATDFRGALDDGRVTTRTADAFRRFLADWVQFREGVGFTGLFTGATVARAREYQDQAVAWRGQLQQAGAQVTGPPPKKSDDGSAPAWLKWAVVGVVGLGTTYAIAKVAGALS